MGIGFVPSHGNFLLIDAPMGGKALFDALLREGVITRPLTPYNMPNHLRISIGTAEEMERCASALARVWKPA
jgi:histidinol-phosphate aminotransferase